MTQWGSSYSPDIESPSALVLDLPPSKISIIYKPPCLWYLCCNSLHRLRHHSEILGCIVLDVLLSRRRMFFLESILRVSLNYKLSLQSPPARRPPGRNGINIMARVMTVIISKKQDCCYIIREERDVLLRWFAGVYFDLTCPILTVNLHANAITMVRGNKHIQRLTVLKVVCLNLPIWYST